MFMNFNFKKLTIILIVSLIIISSLTIVSSTYLSELDGKEQLRIEKACFSTGSGLSDKTYASIYVGSWFANEDVIIQIWYSRDGNILNDGNMVPKTITNDGYIDVSSADSYKYYPDEAEINVYDSQNNFLDSKTVRLSPTDEKQAFDLEIYEDGMHPANPTKAIENHFENYMKNN